VCLRTGFCEHRNKDSCFTLAGYVLTDETLVVENCVALESDNNK
jgi:hypothetical protein